jgi:hypothetical protein
MKFKKNFWKILLTVSLVFSFLVGVNQAVYAENAADPAPEIQARGIVTGKKVLFDNTHGQTAGAADWVIDGGFSDLANALADNGYYVKELRKTTPITHTDLSAYDVVVIGEANISYKTSEQQAMLQYVQNGGSIFFIADHYNADRNKNRWDASEVFNGYRRGAWNDPAAGMTTEERNSAAMQEVTCSDWLGTNFGVRFRYNAIGDVTANNIVPADQSFGVTNGVSTVAMHAGSTVAILDPNKAKGIVYLPPTNVKWSYAVDQGIYNGGGVAEGPYAAIAKVGTGKAAFIGDSSPVEDSTPKYLREETGSSKTTYNGFLEQNDATLLVNIVNWLGQKESYTSLNQVAGLQLDQPTQLLSMETPQTSTEPQPEPWAAPAAGYKWWDPSTFKPGSYGYGTAPSSNHAPTVANPIADQTATAGSGNVTVDATNTFTDADGDALTLSATSSNTGITTVSVSGKILTISPVAAGTATITVTANDGKGGTASDVFTVAVNGSGGSGTAELFFSEYVEGGSYNKALEIYNGTGQSVNLSGYTIEISNATQAINLSGTLANGDVYVIANPSAVQSVLSVSDITNSNMIFNGDDSVTLKHNGTILDVIGTAGVSFGTDKTLVRNSSVLSGNTVYNANEWTVYPKDTFTYLGSHTVSGGSTNHAPTVVSPIADQTATVGGANVTVDATNTFTDADGDSLTLSATSSNTGIATVSVSGKILTISPVAVGTATITVTASDGKGGTVSTTFTVSVTAILLSENFESGSKTAYSVGDVNLPSGSWRMDNALIGNLSSDKKNGAQSVRIKAAGSLSMNFNVTGAKTVKVWHANFGTDTGAVWKLQKSTDSGQTWTDVSGTITSSSTLTEATFTMNETGSIRFKILVSGTSGYRINIDDFTIFY